MVISRFDSDLRRKKTGFAWWRMLTWAMLLTAGFIGALCLRDVQKVWTALQNAAVGDSKTAATLHDMLNLDIAYLAAAFVVIVACAGCILRQAWARAVLRVVALVLSVWLAYRGAQLWHQWNALDQFGAAIQAQLDDLKRPLLIAMGLDVIAVPALLWLAWQLGQPAVRLQFRPRPG